MRGLAACFCKRRAALPEAVTHRVSVILPVLNEERRIAASLYALAAVPHLYEVIVVDGGSEDRTVQRVAASSGVRLVRSRRGRGPQMNAGAAVARGDVLLFLHADVALPGAAVAFIEHALGDTQVIAGAFRTRTVADTQRPPVWAPLLRIADLRSRYTQLPYGDQALFVRASIFRELGGFLDIPLMEDLELSRRLRQRGRIVTVAASVVVSGRRFLARPLSSMVVMNVFPLLYRLGVSPQTLSTLYGQVR